MMKRILQFKLGMVLSRTGVDKWRPISLHPREGQRAVSKRASLSQLAWYLSILLLRMWDNGNKHSLKTENVRVFDLT